MQYGSSKWPLTTHGDHGQQLQGGRGSQSTRNQRLPSSAPPHPTRPAIPPTMRVIASASTAHQGVTNSLYALPRQKVSDPPSPRAPILGLQPPSPGPFTRGQSWPARVQYCLYTSALQTSDWNVEELLGSTRALVDGRRHLCGVQNAGLLDTFEVTW